MANGEYGDIGLRVRQRREELGLTREKMAERAGLSVQFMASVELGKQSMTTDSLKKVCRAAIFSSSACTLIYCLYSGKRIINSNFSAEYPSNGYCTPSHNPFLIANISYNR